MGDKRSAYHILSDGVAQALSELKNFNIWRAINILTEAQQHADAAAVNEQPPDSVPPQE